MTLDEQIQAIVAPYRIVRARLGELLTCSACGRRVEFTYREVCGECFLASEKPRMN